MEPNESSAEEMLFLTMAFPVVYGIVGGLVYSASRRRGLPLLVTSLILVFAVLLPIAHVYGGFDHHAFFRYVLRQTEGESTTDAEVLYRNVRSRIRIFKALSVTSSLAALSAMVVVTEWKRRRGARPSSMHRSSGSAAGHHPR